MNKVYTFGGILLVVLMLGLGGCSATKLFVTPTSSPTPVGPHQIVENTLGLREYWRTPYSCLSPLSPGLVATSGRVICKYYNPLNARLSVRVLDATNGTLLWEALEHQGSGTVVADASRVYFENNFELYAFDLKNGRQLWEKSLTPHRGHNFYSDGEKLNILENGSGGPWMLYTFDGNTGNVLSSEPISTSDDFIRLAAYSQFDLYFGSIGNSSVHQILRAVDHTTHKTLWQVEVPELVSFPNWPLVLLNDVLLIDPGEKVIALDAKSGQVLWKQGGGSNSVAALFATRSVLMNGSLYALRFDGRLLRFDPKTGKETGHIQFMPPLPTYSPQDKFFSLATDGQMLFISFDDSQELIALGP